MTPLESVNIPLGLTSPLLVKRDDLFPVAGGGNKGRILKRVLGEARSGDFDCWVTVGSTQSNHARVCALMAAAEGKAAHIVLHGSEGAAATPTGNLLLMRLAGATLHYAHPSMIEQTLDDVASALERQDKRVLRIPGGGHCLAGALAYADAVDELDVVPDVIIVPSGTGTTQGGLLAGLDRRGWSTRVIGISVARPLATGIGGVRESYVSARASLRLEDMPERPVEFDDRWTCGGYGFSDACTVDTARWVARSSGIVLDPVYTAKAFTALRAMARSGEIDPTQRVVFWHTGGLLNALTAPELAAAPSLPHTA